MALLKNMSKILKNPTISLYTSITSETSPHFTTQKLCNNELQPPPYSKDDLQIISSLEQLKQSIDVSQQLSQIKTITTIFTPKSKTDTSFDKALFDEIYRKLAKTFDFVVKEEYQENVNLKGFDLSNIDKFLHSLIEEKQSLEHFAMKSLIVSFITMVNVYISSISGFIISDASVDVVNDSVSDVNVNVDDDDYYYVYNEHPTQSNVVAVNEDIFVELYEKYLVICTNSSVVEKEFPIALREYCSAFNTKVSVKDVFVEIYWETVFKNKDINELFVKCFYKQLTLDEKVKESVNCIINVLKGIVTLKKEITQNLNVYEFVSTSRMELADVIAFHKKSIDNNSKDDNNSVQVSSEGGSECNYECEEVESNVNVNVKINNNTSSNSSNNKVDSVNEIVRFQSYNVLLDESVNTSNNNNNNSKDKESNTVGIANCIDNIVLDSVVDETNIGNNYLDCCLFDNNNGSNNSNNVNEIISDSTIKEDVCKCNNNSNDDVIKDTRTIEDIINEINTVNGIVSKGSVKKKNKKKPKKRKENCNDRCNGDGGRRCDKNDKDKSCFDNVVDLFKHTINREQVFAWQTQKINPRISSQWIKEISL